MYCGVCGSICVIPPGYEGVRGFGTIQCKKTKEIRVIRCVECSNKHGTSSLIFICVRKIPVEKARNPIIAL